ncbi:MAG: sulfatase [Acidobacteriota bacterium]
MKPTRGARFALAIVGIGLWTACSDQGDKTSVPERIVVVGVDTLRADHLSGYGYSKRTSPVLDRLASDEAIVFENVYSSSSWTLPSMASIFTSLHPMQHQVVDRGYRLDSSLATLAGVLQAAGWRTAGFITHIYVSSLFGLDSGFDEYHELSIDWGFAEGHQLRADALNAVVLPWLTKHTGERFLVYIHFFDPHWDYDPPGDWADAFLDPAYAGPANGSWEFISEFLPVDQLMPEADLSEVIGLYDGEISWTDFQIGRLIVHLRSSGLWDDSLFVVLADHGEELQDHGSMHHIRTLYEEVVRVPLIIKPPGGRAGDQRVGIAERVSNVDIAPTILDYAGIPSPPDFQGRSLRPLMRSVGRDRPVFAHTQRHRSDKAMSIVENLKIIHSWAPGQEGTELYDLSTDPDERTDLAAKDPAITQQELDRLFAEIERMRTWSDEHDLKFDPTSLSPEQLEHLRALGYLD